MRGYLLCADGLSLPGTLVGTGLPTCGELVFNTSVVGYQEILTDPSYCRQIVVMTQPEIGNYGTQTAWDESNLGQANGMVIRSLSPYTPNNGLSLEEFLRSRGLTAIAGLDTRVLTRKLRDQGNQNAIIAPDSTTREEALDMLKSWPQMTGLNLVPEVSTPEMRAHGAGPTKIVLLDFGIKQQTIRELMDRGCTVIQMPWNTSVEEIQAQNPDGVLLSNGPGDPDAVPGVREVVTWCMENLPTMGICLGYQIMALALGGETYKLPFGHRGGNHPVLHRPSGRVYISSQNHGFAVDENSLQQDDVEITHHSLFDQSLEGFRLKSKPVFGVQFHPEAAPGPNDCNDLFDEFLVNIRGNGLHA